ncbi:DUF3347 domain-containing protein [Algibacter pectinivorans]|uniref:DUF3347 domain-containing protein n=1 Tax=Algibacter pectinivorans TaxID=870482 RepID=A0A1I1RKT7_9FLAO|nr:DUF3347 domain-containing protein [Algibacter pectinivorans]SFD34914.1 Protein of unknown function [Algibacter pectinivorans]
MKNLLIAFALGICSYSQAQLSSSQEVSKDLAEKREILKQEITDNYLKIKEDLLRSDSKGAISHSIEFKKALSLFKFKKLTLDQMNQATKTRTELIGLASQLAKTTNINNQRKFFKNLSIKFWEIAEKLKAANVVLHQQICPMTGATWVSNSKEIKNPYYPKNMLACGKVKASI